VEVENIGGIADIFPNDPYFRRQWSLHNTGQGEGCGNPAGYQIQGPAALNGSDINAPGAWTIAPTARGVRVAVVDSGVSAHPDLPALAPGWAFDGGPASDQCNHGTHVAGTIAAEANNGLGVAGVAWGATIVPVRVLSGCNGTDTNYGLGIIWAADHAEVANSSLQYYTVGSFMETAVQYAAERGLVMVAASGNYSQVVAYPARLPGVIAVGSTNVQDQRSNFSNSGPQLDLCAPGENVLSISVGYTGQTPGYVCMSGTSMASPHVAGAAALITTLRPYRDSAEVARVLSVAVVDLGPPGRDNEYGWGRLDLEFAVKVGRCYPDVDGSGRLDLADIARFEELHAGKHPYADLTNDAVWDGADVIKWQKMFQAGCP
jgi:subtilisin family serine protease